MNLDFDVDKYIQYALPTQQRKPIIKAFLKVLLTPIVDLFVSAKTYYLQVVNELQTSILTDVLQGKLRTLYPDVGSFKVFVKTQWDTFPKSHNKYLSEHQMPEYDGFLNEITTPEYDGYITERNLTYDYHVIVPSAYIAETSQITQLLNKFKPAGKRFQLIFNDITI